ncbi:MAG: YggS family pyridoxal phosphate-dependent enzyme [Firmicutes bacterium]|nr:YggS family pyridoxal phosphate-dependent enzyme [Bacillota bacterium]
MVWKENLAIVRDKIERAAARAGRRPEDLTLLVVTKYITAAEIKQLIEHGLRDLGENRIQDARRKQEALLALTDQVRWHFIGSLQTNKARLAVGNFQLIHSLDRPRLAAELNRLALVRQVKVPVLLQVNVSGEESKHGLTPQAVIPFYEQVQAMPGLIPCGLMTMAPYTSDPQTTRPVFRELRLLFERIKEEFNPGPHWRELSMGMSNDYEVAIEEGATIVRIGSAIFGA